MGSEISTLANVILFTINQKGRQAEAIGRFISVEEVEAYFADNSRSDIKEALAELLDAKYLRPYKSNKRVYILTPFGEARLANPTPRQNTQHRSDEYEPNSLESKILRYVHEQAQSCGPRYKITANKLAREFVNQNPELSENEVSEAVNILTYQKYFDKKTRRIYVQPSMGGSRTGPTSSHNTEYLTLSGKALLYLNNRAKRASSAEIFDKETPYKTRRRLEEIFESAKKHIVIGDNYIGRKTLDYLQAADTPIRILTSSSKERGFDEALYDFRMEYPRSLDIRVADGVFHGRFIIVDDNKYYALDHSIKDFGSKPSTIVEIVDTPVQDAFKKIIDDNWK